jgi:hypothetical protein
MRTRRPRPLPFRGPVGLAYVVQNGEWLAVGTSDAVMIPTGILRHAEASLNGALGLSRCAWERAPSAPTVPPASRPGHERRRNIGFCWGTWTPMSLFRG